MILTKPVSFSYLLTRPYQSNNIKSEIGPAIGTGSLLIEPLLNTLSVETMLAAW